MCWRWLAICCSLAFKGPKHIQLGELTLHARCWVQGPNELAHLAPYADIANANGHAIRPLTCVRSSTCICKCRLCQLRL